MDRKKIIISVGCIVLAAVLAFVFWSIVNGPVRSSGDPSPSFYSESKN